MRFHTVAVDMDGTLLNSDRMISSYTEGVLKTLVRRGIELVLATGRLYASPAQYRDYYGLNAHILASNGTVIRSLDEREIYAAAFAPETVRDLIELALEYDAYYYFVSDYTIYTRDRRRDTGAFYQPKGLERDFPRIREIEATQNGFRVPRDVRKFLFYHKDETAMQALREAVASQLDVEISSSFRQNLEITPKGTDKGMALSLLMKDLKRNMKGVLAFGDFKNDLSMLRAAGFSVAMENGDAELKQVADLVAPHHDYDGVAKVLGDFLREGKL